MKNKFAKYESTFKENSKDYFQLIMIPKPNDIEEFKNLLYNRYKDDTYIDSYGNNRSRIWFKSVNSATNFLFDRIKERYYSDVLGLEPETLILEIKAKINAYREALEKKQIELNNCKIDQRNDDYLIGSYRKINQTTVFIKHYRMFIEFLNSELEKHTTTKIKKPQNPKTGFKTTLSKEAIETLHNELKTSYIENTTELEHFKSAFKPQKLPNGFIKINWITSKENSQHSLAYFINELIVKRIVITKAKWKTLSNCFLIDGESINNQAFKKNQKDTPPKNATEIDQIIGNIIDLIDQV